MVKIQVPDFKVKPSVYSFQQYVQDYSCQMLCAFYRMNDASKFLSQQLLKQKVLERSQENETQRSFKGR